MHDAHIATAHYASRYRGLQVTPPGTPDQSKPSEDIDLGIATDGGMDTCDFMPTFGSSERRTMDELASDGTGSPQAANTF